MTFVLIHAAGNMFARAAVRHAVVKSADNGDVFTLSEALKDHGFIRNVPGFDDYTVGELSIGWRSEKFTRGGSNHHMVMRGGRLGALVQRLGRKRDHRRRGPSRLVAWVLLTEKSTGQRVVMATHHAIAKADTAHKWRRPLRLQGFRGVARELRAVQDRFPDADMILTGDMNTVGRIRFIGCRLREVRTPATFGRLRYDRIYRRGGKVTGIKRRRTAGDHKALIAVVTLGGS